MFLLICWVVIISRGAFSWESKTPTYFPSLFFYMLLADIYIRDRFTLYACECYFSNRQNNIMSNDRIREQWWTDHCEFWFQFWSASTVERAEFVVYFLVFSYRDYFQSRLTDVQFISLTREVQLISFTREVQYIGYLHVFEASVVIKIQPWLETQDIELICEG